MPVRDRRHRRLVRLGVIRLGHQEERQSQDGSTYTYPVQDDHFVLRDAPEIEKFYHDRGTEKVRELDVLLPFPDVDRNFSAWYQVWAGGVLVCQGDGEYVQYATPFTCSVSRKGRTSVRGAAGDTLISNGVAQVPFEWGDHSFGEGEYVPCPGSSKGLYPHCEACRLSGLLKVMMADPDLFRFGYYQISTGSGRNHDTILGVLESMPANNLNGIPFKLRLVKEQTTYQDENGQRKKVDKWFLQLEPDPEITRQLYRRQVSRMLDAPGKSPMLPENTGWDEGIIVDEPVPPPYAEIQTPIEVEVIVESPAPIELVPAPEGLTRDNLPKMAAEALSGYEDVGKVMIAMLHIYGTAWSKSDDWTPKGAWAQLQEHKAAPSA